MVVIKQSADTPHWSLITYTLRSLNDWSDFPSLRRISYESSARMARPLHLQSWVPGIFDSSKNASVLIRDIHDHVSYMGHTLHTKSPIGRMRKWGWTNAAFRIDRVTWGISTSSPSILLKNDQVLKILVYLYLHFLLSMQDQFFHIPVDRYLCLWYLFPYKNIQKYRARLRKPPRYPQAQCMLQ